jgi:perosamine synthetase
MTDPASALSQDIESTLRSVLPEREHYALHEPLFAGNEWSYVKSCIDDAWVSSGGAFVDRFEADLAGATGVGHAVACVSGTSALQVALGLAGVQPGDEVLVPALTFVATANAVMHCGADPVFVDSSPADLGVHVDKLREFLVANTTMRDGSCVDKGTGRIVRAIVPVHVFGHPCRMDAIQILCDEHSIAIVEDATEALGTRFLGKHVGGWGVASVLSFNGNKVITTGGGGAILTNDAELARRAKHITTTAKVPHAWRSIHDEVAYNYRLPNLNAALGCAQLESLDAMLVKKRGLASRYAEAFAPLEGVSFLREPADARSNYWLNAIMLDPGLASCRDAVLDELVSARMYVRPVWELLSNLPMYRHCQRTDLTEATGIAARTINIPSGAGLGV